MMISTRSAAIVVLMCAAAVRLAAQQSQPTAPAKPDSPAIIEQLDRLKASVGPRWADAVHFWCEAPRVNRPDDPAIQPAKTFDNVYTIGNVGTVAYVIRTSAGLMMIDALGANQVESDLLPGFTKLGLDRAIVETPRRLARLVGAPVIHASIVGAMSSANALDGSGSRVLQFSGESQIVDGEGKSIAIRHFAEGEGVLVADIRPKRVAPSEAIPAGRFWTPEGMDDDATFWHTSGAAGRTAYLKRRATL